MFPEGDMAVSGRHDGRIRKLRVHIKHKEERTNWKWWATLSFQNPLSVTHVLQKGCISKIFPDSTTNGEKVFKHLSLYGTFSYKPPCKVCVDVFPWPNVQIFLFFHVTSFRKPACIFLLEVNTSFPGLILTAYLFVSLCLVFSVLWWYGLDISLSNSYVELCVVVNARDSNS